MSWRAVRAGIPLALAVLLGACAVWTVDPHELQRGNPDGMQFSTHGRPSYDQVWNTALKAMGQGMVIVESHKPSGTIRARVGTGTGPTDKAVALFITPTDARAPRYMIELVAKSPMGLGQPVRRHPEYAAVAEVFAAALGSP